MSAEAEIAHQVPGRLRLRLAGRKGDREFFERLEARLGHCPGVQQLAVNAYTGSVLIHHEVTVGAIMDYGRTHDLFVPGSSNQRRGATPTQAALKAFQKVDSGLRDRTAGTWDVRELAFLALSIGGLVQTARQNFLPNGFTLLWYATGLLQQKFRHDNLPM